MAERIPRVPVREQDPLVRARNFEEVCYGYDLAESMREASRCLHCKNPRCVGACPVGLQIPDFIEKVASGDIAAASDIISMDSSLPAICGRVCPQETQCEGSCILGIKGEPVAIGKLERFVGDWALSADGTSAEAAELASADAAELASAGAAELASAGAAELASAGAAELASAGTDPAESKSLPSDDGPLPFMRPRAATLSAGSVPAEGQSLPAGDRSLEFISSTAATLSEVSGPSEVKWKVAVIGSGPAGLACAGDLAKAGCSVTIFEALHKAGGVLQYGIPEFRLPKDEVVEKEIGKILALGVKIETNVIVGRTVTIDSLLDEEGFDAVFIGTGAGLPKFMGIPGENLNGVFSANEFLTRTNLMKAYREDYLTPVRAGRKCIVVGGGNVAMDAARTALRLGADTHIVYRRTEVELPARKEEVHHAKEEGIVFNMLTNPVEVLSDEQGNVRAVKCIRMELGEPDASGRRSPVPVEGSEFEIEADTVIMALGTAPNPLIVKTTDGLEATRRGGLVADEAGATTRPGIFAGGDAVTGAATVILAMGAGRRAARAILEYLA